MTKTCTDCGKTLWAKNRSGRCQSCNGRAILTAAQADPVKKAMIGSARYAATVQPVTIHGVNYPSMTSAAEALGVSKPTISLAFLRGRVATIGVGTGNGRRAP